MQAESPNKISGLKVANNYLIRSVMQHVCHLSVYDVMKYLIYVLARATDT